MEKTLTLRIENREPDAVLAAVSRVAGVRVAKQLKPDSNSPLGRSLAYALVEESANLEDVRRKIAEISGVRSCSIPSERYAL